jgi:hypothetical protein
VGFKEPIRGSGIERRHGSLGAEAASARRERRRLEGAEPSVLARLCHRRECKVVARNGDFVPAPVRSGDAADHCEPDAAPRLGRFSLGADHHWDPCNRQRRHSLGEEMASSEVSLEAVGRFGRRSSLGASLSGGGGPSLERRRAPPCESTIPESEGIAKRILSGKGQNPERKGQNPERKGQNPESKGQNPERKAQNPERKGQNPERKGQNPESKGQNPERKRQNPERKGQNPD